MVSRQRLLTCQTGLANTVSWPQDRKRPRMLEMPILRESTSIHTLDARGNVMLEVLRAEFNIDSGRMQSEIQSACKQLTEVLAKKGVNYGDLRSALVPSQVKREVALVFDTRRIENGWYGREVFERLIPLLDRQANHSILAGDYVGAHEHQDFLFEAFSEAVVPCREIEFRRSNQFYIVYINNVTETMVRQFNSGLVDYDGYVGYADTTCQSRFKLALKLVHLLVKMGKFIIQGDEDDIAFPEDINTCGYPFPEHGYVCRSVPGYLFDLFMSYKLERPVFKGFESDTEFSLNAVVADPENLSSFTVVVDERKLDYLKREKAHSLALAGFESLTAEKIAQAIQRKVSSNYIYSMTFDPDHDLIKFNIIVELQRTERMSCVRLLAALHYIPAERVLRLITLY